MPKIKETLLDKLTLPVIAAMQDRTVKHKDLALRFGVTATHLSRTLTANNFKRTPSAEYAARKKATLIYQARAENRRALAKKIAEGGMSIEVASKIANCSTRTMHRYLREEVNQ